MDLRELTPTSAELAVARAILGSSDDRRKKSAMAAMTAFVKRNDTANNADIAKSRGQERQDYLLRYMALQQRKAKGITTNEQVSTHEETENLDYVFWCKFEMTKNVGEAKAEAWIQSGKLTWHPDRVTGSEDPEVREYEVPVKWLRTAHGAKSSMGVKTEAETSEQDMINLQSMSRSSKSDYALEIADKAVKEEPKDPEELKQEQVKIFLKDAGTTLWRLQDTHLDISMISARAQESKHTEVLGSDCKKLETKNQKLRKTMEKIVIMTDQVELSEIPQLMKAVKQHDAECLKVKEWGEKLGIVLTSSKAVKRKRRA